MTRLSYNDRLFRSLENSGSGEVGDGTIFHYRQDGDLVWATYSGGEVRHGTLIAIVNQDDELDMRYHHLNHRGALMTGVCRSRPEVLPDGRLRLHEDWQWTSGDGSKGASILEEIPEKDPGNSSSDPGKKEVNRLLRLMRSTFDGTPWHGPALWRVVADLTAQQSSSPPTAGEHSIWTLVRHLTGWIEATHQRISGSPEAEPEENFPQPTDDDSPSWQEALAALRHAHEKLCSAVSDLSDEHLSTVRTGHGFSARGILHGVVHHNLYHAGQIALLRRGLGLKV